MLVGLGPGKFVQRYTALAWPSEVKEKIDKVGEVINIFYAHSSDSVAYGFALGAK